MKKRWITPVVLVMAAACSGGDDGGGTPQLDAPAAAVDAPISIDTATGTACTNAAYDPCTTNDQCTSNNCHLFSQQGFQVCTAACTPGDNTTCPVDKSGVNGTCNNMGICKPSAPNDCTR
jgi:hypothetical protein